MYHTTTITTLSYTLFRDNEPLGDNLGLSVSSSSDLSSDKDAKIFSVLLQHDFAISTFQFYSQLLMVPLRFLSYLYYYTLWLLLIESSIFTGIYTKDSGVFLNQATRSSVENLKVFGVNSGPLKRWCKPIRVLRLLRSSSFRKFQRLFNF